MLNFILGKSGTGKTSYIKNLFAELCKKGDKKLMMLVPDQSSFETEKSFLKLLGPKLCRDVQVFGFSRLCDYVFTETGNFRNNPIDDGTRKIIMSLAIEQVSDNLELFSKRRGRASLIDLMVHSYKECAKCNITPDMLLKTSEAVGEETLSKKLVETSYVLKAYEAIISNTYIDPCEDLTKACEILGENNIFKDYTIALDSFSGFTAQQYSVIECLMKDSKDFYVSLTLDPEEDTPSDCFKTTFETKKRIFNIAQKNSVKTDIPVLCEENYRIKSPDLISLEENIYRDIKTSYKEIPKDLCIVKCNDIYEEADFVSNNIKKLVAEDGLRYKDIAVICRNAEKYTSYVLSAFAKNDIPSFTDYPEDIYIKPVIRLVCSAFSCITNNFEREDVLSLLKTGLTDNTFEEIAVFENYLFIWNVNRNVFNSEFKNNPRGFSSSFSDNDSKELEIAEKVRKSIIIPLTSFKEKCKDSTGSEISKAVYELLISLNVPDSLDKLYDELEAQGKIDLATQQIRLWNILMTVLDKMTAVLDNTKITAKKYFDLLSIQFENVQISEIPQSIDSVQFGDAQRIRLDNVKAVFILGANEGEFPSVPSISGVFTETERKQLALVDLPFQDSAEEISYHEKFLAYSCLSAPSEKLWVIYTSANKDGDTSYPSEFVVDMLSIFPKIKISEPALENTENKLWSQTTAFEYLARNFKANSDFNSHLKNYFSENEKYSSRINTIESVLENKPIRIKNKETAEKLFGNNLHLSASQIENFNLCAFQYFCNYGLRVRERRPAAIDSLEFGTITHYFFEKFLKMHPKETLKDLSVDDIKTDIDKIYEDYANANLGGLENKTKRFLNLYERMKENSFELISHMIKELSQSDFTPVDFELKIGGDIKAYTLKLPTGHNVSVIGSVDRVDLMERNGKKYIRIIDYKTGKKEFALSDVLYGLNLQMLIYLHAIEQNGSERYGENIVPSGILYMLSTAKAESFDVGTDQSKIDKTLSSNLKMNGLVLNDIEVVEGMDKTGSGKYIPVSIKSGIPTSAKSLASLEQMGHIFNKIDEIITKMSDDLYSGEIPAKPIKGKTHDGCKYCLYSSVCNYKDGKSKYKFAEDFKAKEVMEKLNEEYGEEESKDE